MFKDAFKKEKFSGLSMDDIATSYANKMTENKKTISWIDFWRIAYDEKMRELQARSLDKAS